MYSPKEEAIKKNISGDLAKELIDKIEEIYDTAESEFDCSQCAETNCDSLCPYF